MRVAMGPEADRSNDWELSLLPAVGVHRQTTYKPHQNLYIFFFNLTLFPHLPLHPIPLSSLIGKKGYFRMFFHQRFSQSSY